MKYLLFILLFSMVFPWCFATSGASEAPDLLIPVAQARSMSSVAGTQAAAARSRGPDSEEVAVDFSAVDPSDRGPSEISIALPQQTLLIVKEGVEERESGGHTWRGKVFGSELSSVVLTIDRDTIFGSIDFDGMSYSLESVDGRYVVTRKDPSRRGPLADDAVPPAAPELARPQAARALSIQAATTQDATTQAATAVAQTAESGSRIDLLVLYTAALQAKYGDELPVKIQHFVDLANTAYAQSGVSTKLSVVGKVLFNDAGAAEVKGIDAALTRITESAQVATLRNQYKADLVSLLRVYPDSEGGESSCGLGYIMQDVDDASFADWAFSVTEVWGESDGGNVYCPETTLAHELGHNMGCAHDRNNASTPGAYPYSYGYAVDGIGTIMSYEGETITYFSTPLKMNDWGNPIGIAAGQPDAADNARTINNTRTTVANFRVKPIAATPGSIAVPAADSNGAFTVSWGASATAGVNYTLQEATDSAFSDKQTVYSGPELSAPISGRALGAVYYYRVRATKTDYTASGWRASGGCAVPGTAAAVPTSITVPPTDGNGSFTVRWGASATAGASYTLQEAKNSVFTTGLRTVYSGSALSVALTGRALGAKYYYRVRAVGPGYKASSWRISGGCAVPGTLIATPGSLNVPATDSNGSYTVSWGASATAGVSYILQEAANSAFSTGLRTAYRGSALSASITGRAQGAKYYYRVRAIKSGYTTSSWRVSGGCAVPGTLVATPASIKVPATDADGAYTVKWGASATAGVSYTLQEARNSVFSVGLRTAYSGSALSAAITGRASGKKYYYRARARKSGYTTSGWRVGGGCVVN